MLNHATSFFGTWGQSYRNLLTDYLSFAQRPPVLSSIQHEQGRPKNVTERSRALSRWIRKSQPNVYLTPITLSPYFVIRGWRRAYPARRNEQCTILPEGG